MKQPNIKELPAAVQPLLRQKGFRASGRRIQQLGEAPGVQRSPPPAWQDSSQRAAEEIDFAPDFELTHG